MKYANDVVVVDDDPTILMVLTEILLEHGYTVRTASDGFAVLSVMRERVPNILLSDLYMPGMSGFELLSVVRRRVPGIAVIAMSGAHAGHSIPPGVAADGFYAKGSSGLLHLFNIMNTIQDEGLRQSMRGQVPIWVPALPACKNERSTMSVACPECMRPFAIFFMREGVESATAIARTARDRFDLP